jgi:hypothetical protein
MHATLHLLTRTDFPALRRRTVETLQLNLGYRCNQSCLHCHVNAGPKRTEEMTPRPSMLALDFIAAKPGIATIDLTGGSPEINPAFPPWFVAARARGTARDRPLQPDHPRRARLRMTWRNSSRQHRVEIVASLPCYLEENVDQQRGKGVFEASLRAACKRSTRWATAEKAAACPQPGLQPATARACRQPQGAASRLQAAPQATSTASSSTNCSPWPTCRSSASAAP